MSKADPHFAVRAVVAIYREFEQVARKGDISMAQYRLMLYLRNGPHRAGEVAAAAEITKGTASVAISALRDRGWIEDTPDQDGRVSAVTLSSAGLRRMRAFEDQMAETMAALMDIDRLTQVREALSATYSALADSRDRRFKDLERR